MRSSAFVILSLLGLAASVIHCIEPLGAPPVSPSYSDGGWECPPGMTPYLRESMPRCIRADAGN